MTKVLQYQLDRLQRRHLISLEVIKIVMLREGNLLGRVKNIGFGEKSECERLCTCLRVQAFVREIETNGERERGRVREREIEKERKRKRKRKRERASERAR